jgi:uncharacterized RDD family membrane protein YckC
MIVRESLEPAALWRRSIAKLIDAAIAMGPGVPMALLTARQGGAGFGGFWLWWFFLYFLFADGMKRGSFGKRLTGLRTLDDDTHEPCTYGQSFVRNLFILILGPIDLLFTAISDDRLRLGDRVAGTIVVDPARD